MMHTGSDATLAATLASLNQAVRTRQPLVHCLSNAVVLNVTANVLLACGAAPAMVTAAEEAGVFAAQADALSLNLGTLDAPQIAAMRAAVDGARAAARPWVLDPVAVGALPLRTGFAHELLDLRPTGIRGNASEILALSGMAGGGRGVDSTAPSQQALAAAQELARRTGAVVGVTGTVDYVTDGRRTLSFANGDPAMTRVTGIGCALSAMCAAWIAVADDALLGMAGAVAFAGVAGSRAATRVHAQARANDVCGDATAASLPGSFAVAYLDELGSLGREAFLATLRSA